MMNVLKHLSKSVNFRNYADMPSKVEKSMNNKFFIVCISYNVFFLNIAMNAVTILGRVGADPQKRGNEEHPVVTFSVATHNNYK